MIYFELCFVRLVAFEELYCIFSNKCPCALAFFKRGPLLEVKFSVENSQKIQILDDFDVKG